TLGRTKGSMVSVNLVANTDLQTPQEFRQLVVKEHDGVVVRLGDIADVVLGAENYEQDVRFDGQGATFMGVWVLPGANTLDVIHRVRKVMPDIEAQLPVGMKAGIPYDSTEYIESAIGEVLVTLSHTLLIVVAVIFLFLGSVRSLLIPVIAIPISLIGAVFLMMIAGFTINLMTLLAIVLSVGLVVDDAIVMVENVERHLRSGLGPFRAAIEAAREQPALRRDPRELHAPARRHAQVPARHLRAVGRHGGAHRPLLLVLAAGAGPERGSGRGLRRGPGLRELDPRPDPALCVPGRERVPVVP